jgi:glutamate:Na+ symporter, ESS family
LVLAPRFIPLRWSERGTGDFGQGSGMVVTGLLLMRISDPDNRSQALERFGYKQRLLEPFVGGLVTALALPLAAQLGSWPMLAGSCLLTLAASLGRVLLGRSLQRRA